MVMADNDRELLELAAKAAGISHPGGEHSIANDGRLWDCNKMRWWNPLTDDGDALRLAVKLDMLIDIDPFDATEPRVLVIAHAPEQRAKNFIERRDGDPCAATRRAIVRAAADIGRSAP
jgi:hypothetical protein